MSEIVARGDVLTAHLSGEAVLLDIQSKNYHRLNSTAAYIWGALERGSTREALIADLCARFQASREVIEEDLDRILREFDARHLLRRESGADPAA